MGVEEKEDVLAAVLIKYIGECSGGDGARRMGEGADSVHTGNIHVCFPTR